MITVTGESLQSTIRRIAVPGREFFFHVCVIMGPPASVRSRWRELEMAKLEIGEALDVPWSQPIAGIA